MLKSWCSTIPETAVERFGIQKGFDLNTKNGGLGCTQKVKLKRFTDSRKISMRQDVVITLGKDYPNAAQTITCERCLA